MSTTPNNPAPLTDEQVDAYIRQVAADEYKKNNPAAAEAAPAPQSAPAPQPFKMNLAGQEYAFNTPEEAQNAMNNLLAQQAQQREAQANSGRRVTADEAENGPKFDMNTYVNKMAANPIDAQEYLDEIRFGVKNPSQVFRQMMQAQQEQARVMAVYQFKEVHPDYQGTPENANAINTMLQQYNLPWSSQGLEAAYALAVRQGHIKGHEEAKAEVAQPAAPAYNPYLAPPPVASRSQAAPDSASWSNDAENLSTDAIESIFARFQK